MIKVTVGDKTWTGADLASLPSEAQIAMVQCYGMGDRPQIETLAAPLPVVAVPFPENANDDAPVFSDFSDLKVDAEAKERIDRQQAAIGKAGGFVANDRQFFDSGTRMMAEGYSTQSARKADHDAMKPVREAANELVSIVRAENRRDIDIEAGEFGAVLVSNGKVTFDGKALTEQAIRGLAARLESPFLGYVLGLRDRVAGIVDLNAKDPDPRLVSLRKEDIKSDVAVLAFVLAHECKRNPYKKLRVRTRNGNVNDVFAIVSQEYSPADAPEVIGDMVDRLSDEHPNARGKYVYDPKSTAWEMQAEIWTPTPVEKHAVGEPFRGYVSIRGKDNGTGHAGGGGGIELLRCLNASTYMMQDSAVKRVHRGAVLRDLAAMIRGGLRACSVLSEAWGVNRTREIPLTAEEKASGDRFMTDLWLDTLRNDRALAGVLPGRVITHAEALTATYHAERRDHDKLVRADMAQSWTRYIQGQRPDIRKDAEAAIGRWLVEARA